MNTFQVLTFSKLVSFIKPMVKIIAKNIEDVIVPKLSPPFSIGFVTLQLQLEKWLIV